MRNTRQMEHPVGRAAAVAMFVVAGLSPAMARPTSTPSSPATSLIPPVVSACVSSPFGPRILPHRPLAGTYHNGIDLPAPIGSPVIAVAPGTVIRAQRNGIGGLEVLIQHEGFVGVYSHLGLIAPVIADGGRTIYGGERIATVGRTGLTYGPHLYFGMIVSGRPVDPAPYLKVLPCGAGFAESADSRIRPTHIYMQHRASISLGDDR